MMQMKDVVESQNIKLAHVLILTTYILFNIGNFLFTF